MAKFDLKKDKKPSSNKAKLEGLKEELGLLNQTKTAAQERVDVENDLISIAQQHSKLLQKDSDKLRDTKDIEKDIVKLKVLSNNASVKDYHLVNKILKDKQKELEFSKQKKKANENEQKQLGVVNELFGKSLGTVKKMPKSFGDIGKSITKGLSNPLIFLLAALENSTAVNQLQKELGVGYKNALLMKNEFGAIARDSGDVFITSKKLQEAFFDMQSSLGFVANYSGETLETMTNLTKRLGLGKKEAAEMTALFKLQGNNTEEIASNTMDSLTSTIKLGKVALSPKQIFAEISKTSKSIQVSLGANPAAIGKAIIAAKQFGAELSDVDAITGNLLNFESSISSELEAELLTGKQLNLERARSLALNNDLEGVGKEIAKQGLDYNFFSKANRLEQEAAAKALGVSRDRLAEITFQQRIQGLSSKEIKDQLGEGAYEQAKALSAQDKFNASVEKLKGLFTDVMVVLTPVIDAVAGIADLMGKLIGFTGKFTGLIAAAIPVLLKMSFIMKAFALRGFAGAVAAVFRTFSKIPFGLGIPLAVGAVGSLVALMSKKPKLAAGGIIKPTVGGTDVTIGEAGQPEAVIPLNRAGEFGLGGGGNGSGDINQIANRIESVLSKGLNVNTVIDYDGYASSTQQGVGGVYNRSTLYEGEMS